jgi:SAM-dependent methyltransferase
MEHVQDTHRLALMNLLLHGLDSRPGECGIWYGDTLSGDAEALPPATLILTNPPFGTKKGGGLPSRKDFTFPTSNKQFCFLQHIYRALKPGGRAAVLDFNRPDPADPQAARISGFQQGYLRRVVVPAARRVGLEQHYAYLEASLAGFASGPRQELLAQRAGFAKAHHRALAGGLMGLLELVA